MSTSKSNLLKPVVAFGAALGLVATLGTTSVAEAADKLSIALPGVPPVFSTAFIYTAKGAGFYKKYNLEVRVRPFNSGVAAAKAVVSGAVDMALSPTAPVARMVSNAGVSLVGLQGLEKPDWVIGSMDPSKNKCSDLKGQAVGVDSPRGARWINLANMVRPCKLRPDKNIKTVNLSSNVGSAMVAGQLTFGVLHLDDIPVIERESGKKVTIIAEIEKASPGTHYLMIVTTKKMIASKRDILVRATAAHIEAIRYMYDPSNNKAVAGFAKATGRKLGDAQSAVKVFTAFNYWPNGHAGLDAKRLAKTIKIQAIVGKRTKGKGGIKPSKKPVSIGDLTDSSVFADAMALVNKKK
jgi:NitT/TauT family transport system substrate-binding protein